MYRLSPVSKSCSHLSINDQLTVAGRCVPCNWSALLLTVLHCYCVTEGIMHCILLAILSRLSRFPATTVGTD